MSNNEDARHLLDQAIALIREAQTMIDQSGTDIEPIPYGSWPPPDAMASGSPYDPAIAPLLDELQGFLMDHEALSGIGWSAKEITTMQGPGRPVAIPVRGLWHLMVPTLALYERLRERLGQPCSLRGYRPPDYNAAVGGASKSAHLWFAALDVYAPVEHRNELARIAADIFTSEPDLQVGLGIYGRPHSSNIHIDVDAKGRRTWADTQQWLG